MTQCVYSDVYGIHGLCVYTCIIYILYNIFYTCIHTQAHTHILESDKKSELGIP